ncbi:hypothetical protein [Oceanobacter mangrovi]|uniref:hypothetical protein n=1 Tax=Oceanobacter mangrovi TaxID=2862510 RepID=UPI001C8E5690|nr:hypothetical protein [Oceanobacter mangrovi]
MELKTLYKVLPLAIAAASLAACGGGSSSSGGSSDSTSATKSLSSNPDFTFDQTTYVGAVDPSATDAWYSFALAGSIPAATDIVSGGAVVTNWQDSIAEDFTPNMDGITAATECPSLASGNVFDTGETVTLDGQDFIKCRLSGSIDEDTELTNDVIWNLAGQVYVGDGNKKLTSSDNTVDNATLTIPAGTIFMSDSGASLTVTRGSSINAVGTADQPIIFSGDATETFAGSEDFGGDGEWGGLVLQGYAYNNKCGDSSENDYCNLVGEGDAGYFGGYDNSDSTGTLKYVIVTEAGAQTGADGDELNGISFQSVGYGTTLDYIQINNNYDDGVEFFGGAPDVTHLVITGAKDDSIDWDEGFVGNIQYALIVQTWSQSSDATSNEVFELDTRGDDYESAYLESNPTVANVTAFTSRQTGGSQSNGIMLKEGTEGQFFNIFMAGDINACAYIKDDYVETSYDDRADAFNGIYCSTDTTLTFASGVTESLYDGVEDKLTNDSTYVVVNSNLALTATPATAYTIESKTIITE